MPMAEQPVRLDVISHKTLVKSRRWHPASLATCPTVFSHHGDGCIVLEIKPRTLALGYLPTSLTFGARSCLLLTLCVFFNALGCFCCGVLSGLPFAASLGDASFGLFESGPCLIGFGLGSGELL